MNSTLVLNCRWLKRCQNLYPLSSWEGHHLLGMLYGLLWPRIRVPLLWDGFSACSIFRHKPVSPKPVEKSWMLELKLSSAVIIDLLFSWKNKSKIQSPCVHVYIHTHTYIHIYIDIHIVGTSTSDNPSELNKRYQMYFVIFLEVSYKAQTMQIISPNDCAWIDAFLQSGSVPTEKSSWRLKASLLSSHWKCFF